MAAPIPNKRDMLNLPPGTKLGKYELVRRIAVGGMAELYLARTISIGGFEKLVVLKRTLPHYNGDAAFTQMFLDEAKLAATLHHHNIAQVYDIGADDGGHFFAMEYVHGADLRSITEASERAGTPIPLECAVAIVIGAATGLHYAHDKVSQDGEPLGLVHRDVSPQNILVSYDGTVKLTDFGIAKAASSGTATATGSLKGKVSYMSPEQCGTDLPLDRRSDIFPLGAILWELTVGRRLFHGERDFVVIRSIFERDAPAPSSVTPGYPPRLEQIVMRALRRNRDERYATAQEFQHDLEDFAHERRLRTSPRIVADFMRSLFGEKLDEWKSAVEHGAFFVEEHIVKTFDGRDAFADSESTNVHGGPQVFGEEEKTAVRGAPEPDLDEGAPTNVTPNPLLGPQSAAPAPALTPTPVPGPAPMPVAAAGLPAADPLPTLAELSPSDDRTAAVSPLSAPRTSSSETRLGLPRRWWLAIPVLSVLVGVIAAVAISAGGDGAAKSPAPAEAPADKAGANSAAAGVTGADDPDDGEPADEALPINPGVDAAAGESPDDSEPARAVTDDSSRTRGPTSDDGARRERPRRRSRAKRRDKPKPKKKRTWHKDSIYMPE